MGVELTKKQKILLRMAGMTAVVYLVFKYLIPLIIPFLIAVLLSIPIRPMARFFYKKLHIPIGAAAGLLLVLFGAAAGLLLVWLGRGAVSQLALLSDKLPGLWEEVCQWLFDCCDQVERGLHLSRGAISGSVVRLTDMSENGLGAKTLSGLLDGLMNASFQWVKLLIEALATIFITIGATLITTTQLEEIKKARDRSLFREEINRILTTLSRVGAAYGKTQLLIMLCTMGICTLGLTVLGNPYAILLGILIGLLDALPVFGVGTALWPWIFISVLSGRFWQAVGLAVIYGASALVREIMEARYMGEKIGLGALENLISMYVGMRLFGLLGLFFGPMGYLLIKEAVREPSEEM